MGIMLEALIAKYPDVEFELVNNSELKWKSEDIPKPTEQEIEQIIEEFRLTAPPEDELALNWYQARQLRYPPIEQQLDMLYHKGYDGWKAEIDKVKSKYPKPVPVNQARPHTGEIPVTEI